MINHYHTLGLTEVASQTEIKAAFKKLAVKFHPDKNPDDPQMEELFKVVNEAYQTLSNPYEKARYDIRLRYGTYVQEPTYPSEPNYSYPPPPRPRPSSRPTYKPPPVNWRENWIATAYAFGFTFLIACVVMTVVTIKNYVDKKEFEKLLNVRRSTFELVKKEVTAGDIEPALQKLNGMGAFYSAKEGDMELYKVHLYESFIYQGEVNFFDQKYPEAAQYYQLVEKYASYKPITIKEHLAIALRKSNQPEHAIKVMKELLLLGHSTLDQYLQIGEIYRDDLRDSIEALRFYKLADITAIGQYKSYYGEAYGLIISARSLPHTHYKLYTGLADLYLRMDSTKKAIKVTDWNLKLWPDSVSNYVIAAKGHERLGNIDQACILYRQAETLGWKNTPRICRRN